MNFQIWDMGYYGQADATSNEVPKAVQLSINDDVRRLLMALRCLRELGIVSDHDGNEAWLED